MGTGSHIICFAGGAMGHLRGGCRKEEYRRCGSDVNDNAVDSVYQQYNCY